jgi:hypothetical protein
MRNDPRWFLLALPPDDREYVRDRLAVNRYRFEEHREGFLVFTRTLTTFAQWLSKQGIRIRTVPVPAEAAA